MTSPATAILAPRPVVGRGNARGESEQKFYDWLVQHGWEIAGWECQDFHLGQNNWLRPDCKLASGVFLEHTDADTHMSKWVLSAETRRNNRKKPSGKSYISPMEYLARKRERIALAEKRHGITIVLLPAMVRDKIEQDPTLLQRLIDMKLTMPASYEDWLDRQLSVLQ